MFFGLFGKRQDINLVPEEEQKSRVNRFRIIVTTSAGLILLGTIGLFLFIFLLNQNEKSTKSNLEQELSTKNSEWQLVASPAAQVKTIKAKLKKYQSFSQANPDLVPLIDEIVSILPQKISLTTLTLTNTGEASVEGTAADPSAIYQFVEVLNKEENFNSVTLDGIDKQTESNYSFIIGVVVGERF